MTDRDNEQGDQQDKQASAGESWLTVRERQKHHAATLLADGDLSDGAIAQRVGVNPATLYRWKRDQAFIERTNELTAVLTAHTMRQAISTRRWRVERLQRAALLIWQVFEERAAHPDYQDVPGGRTGLLVRRTKLAGVGPDARLVTEWEIDTPALRELRETYKAAAIEAGEYLPKHAQLNVSVLADLSAQLTPEQEQAVRLALLGPSDDDGEQPEPAPG